MWNSAVTFARSGCQRLQRLGDRPQEWRDQQDTDQRG